MLSKIYRKHVTINSWVPRVNDAGMVSRGEHSDVGLTHSAKRPVGGHYAITAGRAELLSALRPRSRILLATSATISGTVNSTIFLIQMGRKCGKESD